MPPRRDSWDWFTLLFGVFGVVFVGASTWLMLPIGDLKLIWLGILLACASTLMILGGVNRLRFWHCWTFFGILSFCTLMYWQVPLVISLISIPIAIALYFAIVRSSVALMHRRISGKNWNPGDWREGDDGIGRPSDLPPRLPTLSGKHFEEIPKDVE